MKERLHKGNSIIDFPKQYISIDVETTGLDYDYDEIIEISALLIKDGEVVDEYTSLVKPKVSHCILTYGYLHELGYERFSDLDENQYMAWIYRFKLSWAVRMIIFR